jgi:hypothetical protein
LYLIYVKREEYFFTTDSHRFSFFYHLLAQASRLCHLGRFLISLKVVLAVVAASFARVVEGIETTFAKIQRTTRPKASAITKRSAVNCGGVWGTPKLPLKILVMNRLL